MKYINKNNVDHLKSILKQDYKLTPTGKAHDTLDSHLTETTKSARCIFSCQATLRMLSSDLAIWKFQLQPHPHTLPTYCPEIQYPKADNTSPAGTNTKGKNICQVIGIVVYYGRAVDSTIHVGLSLIAAAQSKPSAHTLFLVKWLLNYAATNPEMPY
jgi:hypothetical protein